MRVRLGHRIEAVAAQRVAATQAPHGEPGAAAGAVQFDGLPGIFRT